MKIIIYQILMRLYGNKNETRKANGTIEENGCGKMNNLSASELKKIRELGVTHVWYTGILRHASTTDYTSHGIPCQHPAVVKGKAGSPYAIADYYDVDPDLAVVVDKRMSEFERLVSRTHRAGLKVVIDFVPNHVARQYHSIAKPDGVRDLGEDDDTSAGFMPEKNNFYYCPGQAFMPYLDLYHGAKEPYQEMPAKATGNDCFHNSPTRNDWYETVKLNYGVDYYAGGVGHFTPIPDTWHKMLHILLYWASKRVDAFRCDMAEMVPAEFWDWAIAKVKEKYPEVAFIAEVYNPQKYRRYIAAGFDYLYDKVGMYDAVRDVVCHRRDVGAITEAWQQTDDIGQHMLYFLENHDEQRVASDFFAADGRKAVPALVACALMRQNPFMIYFGQEWGEKGMDAEGFSGHDGRTTIFDYWSFGAQAERDAELETTYRHVLNIAKSERAVTDGLSFDLMYVNRQCCRQYAFLRKAENELLLVLTNFDDAAACVNLLLPEHAFNYLDISEGTYLMTDLLSGQSMEAVLQRNQSVNITIKPRGAQIWKITF